MISDVHAAFRSQGHRRSLLLPPCLLMCICFCPVFFFLKIVFHSEPHQNLPTKQCSLLMHKRRMLMKRQSSGRAAQLFFFFPGCIINRKEKPLCLRGVFNGFLSAPEVRPWLDFLFFFYRANLSCFNYPRITVPVSSVPSASTSRWAMSWRPRRRTASTWPWCALTSSTRECSKAAG